MRLGICILLLVGFIGILSFRFLHTAGPQPIPFEIPMGWPKPENNIFAKNKLTREGFELGKKLFYDPRLSKDGQVSCANCHQQFAAFATFDHDLSHGVNNGFTTRNAPTLQNLAWMKNMHWDGGVNHIEVQPLNPLTAANEMGAKLDSVILFLQQDTAYQRLFYAAFGDRKINSQRMLKAMAQFTGSLVSANSRYDRVQRGEIIFKDYEERGYLIYKAKCASCHPEPLFTDNSFRNNGLKRNRFNDNGRMTITNDPADSLKFKVPTLRNVQFSFPYMHDGRIYTLYQVVEHYRTGIDTTQPTLDPLLKSRIPLSTREKNELVYFLYTLTDSNFLKNQRFADGGVIGTPVPDVHKTK